MSSPRSPSATPVARTTPLPESSSSSSDSKSAPRVSSPLNANASNTSPARSAIFLPKTSPTHSPPSRGRGGPLPPNSPPPDQATFIEPLQQLSMTVTNVDASISLPDLEDDSKLSTFRDRSRSPPQWSSGDREEMSLADSKLASSWWAEKHVSIPWRAESKARRQKTLPEEHAIALEETRKRVARAAVSVLGTTAEVIHEALIIGVDLLELAPVPGLAIAAKTLVNIWDSAQNVDMNQLSCLRLTERCADILLSVREEIRDAGEQVGTELAAPISKLEETYRNIYRFMHKQANRPWLKRYIKREEIMRDISDCDGMLRDALALFGVSIQIRILRQVQENDRHRQYETRAVLRAILQGSQYPESSEFKFITESEAQVISPVPTSCRLSTEFATETVTDFATTKTALGLIEDGLHPGEVDHAHLIPALEKIHGAQNEIDASRDISSLRQLMRAALATKTDKEMLEVLQIARRDMPDAIKTLQRARERLAEREEEDMESSMHSDTLTGKITQKVSIQEIEGDDVTGSKTIQRSETIVSIESSSSSGASGRSSGRRRDTLDWEFLEMGIDCLTRMTGAQAAVPNWTITKFEVDREDKIGVGFFSDVYKGTWKGRAVAIKVLAETTPRKLFVREIGIWKELHHPNVLPLYGASSATGEAPWFFVSPYVQNGTLVEYLKRVEQEMRPTNLGVGARSQLVGFRNIHGRAVSLPGPWRLSEQGSSSRPTYEASQSDPQKLTPPGTPKRPLGDNETIVPRERDLLRFMHEISKGMEYLHSQEVLHGDLKASNVLVDHRYRCLIADFGQSEMKSEAFRISGYPPHQGTLRWQAPEFMSGQTPELTPAVDVWAFAITCVEILAMGKVPWPYMDDDAVRHFVLMDNTRPPVPRKSPFYTSGLQELLRNCWQSDPVKRYTFTKIARELKLLRKSLGEDVNQSPMYPTADESPELTPTPSPDMRPRDTLPQYLQGSGPMPPPDVLGESYSNLRGTPDTSTVPRQETTVVNEGIKFPEPVIYTPSTSRSSSIRIPKSSGRILLDESGYESAAPEDEELAQQRNERRYRILLTHEYHPSLILPLWHPTPVEIGAVGYLAKPEGTFVTFFNALNPSTSTHPDIQSLPSIHGYGLVKDGIHREPKPTIAQRAMEIIGSLTSRNTSQSLSVRTSFPLKAGHPAAYLYAESTEYRYIETLDAPRKWFKIHVDAIHKIYGYQAQIAKEDLCLVIGTLRTPKYALVVSHHHPEGHAHFNVYSNPKPGTPWGTFTIDHHVARELGPVYDLEEVEERARPPASKISNHNGAFDAVLLARLRFKTDASEPTSRL
ncbi:hypothetical protein BDN70DRAFT_876798 [Pholiota conissans]|uniref:Protein kinase domain-containing protein n=1 Tax=Pholiota conissans TaxID=109636 RepID=A0A9P5Z569_9AGAR|nr:hypothetical protein BDN70DRAFT_876798 [Pholiota conissans]